MASKRPKLFQRTEADSASQRNLVHIPGTCRVGDRQAEDIVVTDLSAEGCSMRLASIGLTKGEAFTLLLGAEAPISGRLRWVKQGHAGVVFDAPLDAAALERLLALAPPSNVVSFRRSRAG